MDSRFSFLLLVILILICAAAAAADEAMTTGETQIRSDLVSGCTRLSWRVVQEPNSDCLQIECFQCTAVSPSGRPSAESDTGSRAEEPKSPVVLYCTEVHEWLHPPPWNQSTDPCDIIDMQGLPVVLVLQEMQNILQREGIKRVVFEHIEIPFVVGLMPLRGDGDFVMGDISLSFSNVGHLEFHFPLGRRGFRMEVQGILTLTESEIRMTDVTAKSFPFRLMGSNVRFVSAERSSLDKFPGCPYTYQGMDNSEEIRYQNVSAYMCNINELVGCRGVRTRMEILDLNKVNVGKISAGAFQTTSIGQMRIANSSIGTIEQGAFDGLSLGCSFQFLENEVSIMLGGNVFRHLSNSGKQPVTVMLLCNSFKISEVSSFDVEKDGPVHLELDGNDIWISCRACDDLENITQHLVPADVRRPPPGTFQCAGMRCGPTNSSLSAGAYLGELGVGDIIGPTRGQGTVCRRGSPGIQHCETAENLYPNYPLLFPLLAAIILVLLLLGLAVCMFLYKRRKDNMRNAQATGRNPNTPKVEEDDHTYIELPENPYSEPCAEIVSGYEVVADSDARTGSHRHPGLDDRGVHAITAENVESGYTYAVPPRKK